VVSLLGYFTKVFGPCLPTLIFEVDKENRNLEVKSLSVMEEQGT
jgi:hypothetical protein